MAKNVKFIRTTKEKWLNRDTYDPYALYFCEDTHEMCKGDKVLTDGMRVVPTRADLPDCPHAADGVVYYVADTKSGYMMSPDRTEWIQTIYAPIADATTIPESEIYKTVTTVGAVRDIENAIYKYVDQEIANIEVSGGNGLSAYEIWLNNGHTGTESDFLNWLKGKDGYTPVKGVDYFDGLNGKDGKSTYDIWLNAGHNGSEDDFLQWLKGDNDTFGDVVTSISCGGISVGTSLKEKTVKDVLIMLLGIEDAPQSAVEYIIENSIPFYSGLDGAESSEVAYQQLDTATANYTNQGFYTTTNENGKITNAGYQITFEANLDGIAQTFSMYSGAKIVTAYQYHPALNQWVDTGFDGTYWAENGTDTKVINGQEIVYTTYAYNTELMGDAITSPEYWRFEVEVL
jgi:hypothetical protein